MSSMATCRCSADGHEVYKAESVKKDTKNDTEYFSDTTDVNEDVKKSINNCGSTDTKELIKPTDSKELMKPTAEKELIKPTDEKELMKPIDEKELIKPVAETGPFCSQEVCVSTNIRMRSLPHQNEYVFVKGIAVPCLATLEKEKAQIVT